MNFTDLFYSYRKKENILLLDEEIMQQNHEYKS